jgi:hypothetical protein
MTGCWDIVRTDPRYRPPSLSIGQAKNKYDLELDESVSIISAGRFWNGFMFFSVVISIVKAGSKEQSTL